MKSSFSVLMSWFDQQVYRDRSTRVKEVCEKFGLRPEDKTKKYKALQKRASLPPEKSLMYLPTFNLLYCWVHKAASTSWNKIFFKLAEKALNRTLYIPEKSIHEVSFQQLLHSIWGTFKAASVFRPPAEGLDTIISQSLLFMVVRHPFERLVSAFRWIERSSYKMASFFQGQVWTG